MSYTNAVHAAMHDAQLAAGDFIAWSVDGTSEATTVLARTAVVAWNAATVANPSVKSNSGARTSAEAIGTGTISHFAVFSASTGGTQKTNWIPLTTARPVTPGAVLTIASGALAVTLAPAA